MRARAIALVGLGWLAGCAHAPAPASGTGTGTGTGTETGTASAEAFPRHAACVLRTERGLSHPSPHVKCVPPYRHSPPREASERLWHGDYAGAGDCLATAYQEEPRRAEYAFDAARMYRMAKLPVLARVYFRRFLAQAPAHARADEARRALDELGPDQPTLK